jgi:hypothetical protein
MKAARISMVDGTQCLAIPGVGIAMPMRDQAGRIIVNEIILVTPGIPPMPVAETLDSLEEKFNGSISSKLVL